MLVAINPLRFDRVPDRFPRSCRTSSSSALVLVASTFFSDRLLTTSAVSAVVLGFALQDTLGNAFAGLAIQSEKPFHVGHWIRVGEFEGRVEEVTWRATKLRTKTRQLRRPAEQPRVEGSDHQLLRAGRADPARGRGRRRLRVAAERREGRDPRSAAQLVARPASAAAGRRAARVRCLGDHVPAKFWVDDYERDDAARDEARTAIYYAFQRHGIEIPWPIQVGYSKELPERGSRRAHARAGARCSPAVDLFAPLSRGRASASSRRRRRCAVYGTARRSSGRGNPASRCSSSAPARSASCSSPPRQEVARIERGGYFGEMSLLTGEPRSATVLAAGDVSVIEIGAELFRRLAAAESAGDRADRHGGGGASRRPRTHQDRHGRSRDGRDEHLAGTNEEVPAIRRLPPADDRRIWATTDVQLAIRALVSFAGIRCRYWTSIHLPRAIVIVVVAIARAIPFLACVVGILAVPRVVAPLLVAVVHAVLERVACAVLADAVAVSRISTRIAGVAPAAVAPRLHAASVDTVHPNSRRCIRSGCRRDPVAVGEAVAEDVAIAVLVAEAPVVSVVAAAIVRSHARDRAPCDRARPSRRASTPSR